MAISANMRTHRRGRQVAAAFFWLVLWQVVAVLVGHPLLLPGPWETLVAFVVLAGTEVFWVSVGASFGTIASAFLLTFALALVLGGLAVRHWWLQDLIRPLALALKAVPVACVVVLLLLWLGADGVPSAVVALLVFPAYYFTVLEGSLHANERLRDALFLMGVGPVRLFLATTWPDLVPYLLATSKNAVGMSWKAGVAAELIAMALNTMGEKIYQAKLLLETADLFAWTVAVVVLAFACEKGFCAFLACSKSWALRLAVSAVSKTVPKKSLDNGEVESGVVARDLTVARGAHRVCEDVSFSVKPGTALVLRGPSGQGKTTLLLAVLGLVPVVSGEVIRPHLLSVVFQEARLIEELSAEDNVKIVCPGVSREAIREALFELLPSVKPTKRVEELSGGQRRRVELVRAMLCPGGAVLLDEPFQGLDVLSHSDALAFVRARLGRRALLLSTHDPKDADALGASSFILD